MNERTIDCILFHLFLERYNLLDEWFKCLEENIKG